VVRYVTGQPPRAFSPAGQGMRASPIAERLFQFCELHWIPLNAFARHTRISAWAIRQTRDGVRSMPVKSETLTRLTIERIEAGRLWLRRASRQRWELEWVNPPYRPRCPTHSLNCQGGLLPGSCYRRWKECAMMGTDWETVGKIHESYADRKV
jgi:hypothetical protein